MRFVSLKQSGNSQAARVRINTSKKDLSQSAQAPRTSYTSRNSVSSTLAELESISQRQAASHHNLLAKSSRRIYSVINKWQNAFLGILAVRAVRSKKSVWKFLYTMKFWVILTVCMVFIAGGTTLGLRTVMAKYAFTISSLESSINSNTQDIQTAQTEVDNKEANLPIVATKMGMQAASNPTPIMLSQPVSEEAVRQALQTPVAGFTSSQNTAQSANGTQSNTSVASNTTSSTTSNNASTANTANTTNNSTSTSNSGNTTSSNTANTVNTANTIGKSSNDQQASNQTSTNSTQNNSTENLSRKAQ